MAPPHIVFDCEVLTPLFLAGADPNTAELRPASVRGMLRYWLRALLGGRGYTGKALAEQEALVFGSAGMGGVEARASAVNVITQIDPRARIERAKGHKLMIQGSGTGYLWYSAALGQNNRAFYPAGTPFQVALVAPRGDKAVLKKAAVAFWLLAHLGGLGTRNRNGAGCFFIRKMRASEDALMQGLPEFTIDTSYPGPFADFLGAGLNKAAALFPRKGPAAVDFDVIAPEKTRIVVAAYDPKGPLDAAAQIGEDLRNFRTGSRGEEGKFRPRQDMETETLALKYFIREGNPLNRVTFRRPGFGLPFTVRFKKEDFPTSWEGGQADFTAHGLTRRASPLQLHIARGGKNYFDIVLTMFNSHFLPGDARRLQVRSRRRPPANVNFTPGAPLIFIDKVLGASDEDGTIWMKNVEIPA